MQSGKDFELIIGPFNRGECILESDDLLAIVEGASAHQNVGDATCFQRSDVGPRDVRPEIAEPAKQNGDVPRPDSVGPPSSSTIQPLSFNNQATKAPTASGNDSLIRQSTILP